MKKRRTLQQKAFLALKEAVREVVKQHQEAGRPLAVWRNGKVVRVSAERVLNGSHK